MKKFLLRAATMAIVFGSIAPALAEDAPAASPYLSGDWNGNRTWLLDRGFDFQATYTADYWSNISGGIRRGSDFQDNLDLTMAIDGEKAYGLEGSKIWVYLLNNSGQSFNKKRVGSAEGTDNIEVNAQTFKVFEAWIEQNVWHDALSVRAGLYNLNSEFDVTESSGVFLNPTYGIDTAYAGTGKNGPSIFPTSSLAVRVNVAPTENTYIRAAVLDGVPGDPSRPTGTHIKLGHKDGMLVAVEGGYGDLTSGHIGVGGWRYSTLSDHLSEVDAAGNPVRAHGDGAYVIAEKTLYSPGGDADRHLDGFIRFARANDAVSQFDYSGSVGLAYTGPFVSRKNDVAGISVHGAHNGTPYLTAATTSGTPVRNGEYGMEATYRLQLKPWMAVQPDFQYIRNPGSSMVIDHATIVGMRLKVNM